MVYNAHLKDVYLTCGSLDPDRGRMVRDSPRGEARRIYTGEKAWWEAWAEEAGGRRRTVSEGARGGKARWNIGALVNEFWPNNVNSIANGCHKQKCLCD